MELNRDAGRVTYMTDRVIETVRELENINSKTVRDLTSQQLIFSERFIMESAQQLKEIVSSDCNNENELCQIKMAEDLGKMLVDDADKIMHILDRTQRDLRILTERIENSEYFKRYSSYNETD